MNEFLAEARSDARVSRDRSVIVIIALMIALVFAPVVGLHLAAVAMEGGPDRQALGTAHAPAGRG